MKNNRIKMKKVVISIFVTISLFFIFTMKIYANENYFEFVDIISSNNMSDGESTNQIVEGNEMQPESSTIIASGFRGENQEIKWTLNSDGLLYVYGTGNSIDLSNLAYNTNKADKIKYGKIQISGSFYLERMFYNCPSLEEVDFMESNYEILSADEMFRSCTNLNSINFSHVDTSLTTSMNHMFNGCSSLMALDLSNFDTSNVTSMYWIFNGCSSLKTLDLSNFDTSNVTRMDYMFKECSSLQTLNISNFDTSNVTYMDHMFDGCSSLETLDVSSFDTSKVKTMNRMFLGCKSLKSLDVSNFDVTGVAYFRYYFYGCENLEKINLFKLPKGNRMFTVDWMFGGCSSLKSIDLSGWNTDSLEIMNDMFADCTSLQTLDLSSFNIKKVKAMRYMFNNCTSLQSVNFSGFNTENLTDMTAMFNNCSSLQNIDFSGFKTDKVTSMKYMFYGCDSLKNLDISNFNMSSLAYEDGEGMKIFSTMDNIETIKMPANLTYSIALPYEHYIDSTGAQKIKKATWYDQSGNQCYSTLTGQSTPVLYYRKNTSEVNTPSKSQMITSFVERMYTVVLNRSAEEEGMAYWSGRLKNGTSDGASLARGFICCKEFKDRRLDNSSYLDVLYRTFFDREADAEGKAYWMDLLAKGYSREFILSRFVNSKEFAGICDSYEIARGTMEEDGSNIYNAGVRNFVLRNYTKALGRTGETEGVEYWSHLINIKRVTALDCAKYFFHSKEFLDKNLNDEAYLETLYATYFDRASDAEGKAYWLNHMKNGMSRDEVLAYFANSKEFKQIMSEYGL